tara:strand:+ start:662 stop:1393 length:732 start_codon:yes stop_codon:yes gene_type:complete
MDFNTQSNKGFMWNLMYENGMFANIPSSKVDIVKNTFDELVSLIDSRSPEMSLKEKNKQVLLQMNAKRNEFVENNIPVTAAEAANIRSEKFSRDFNKKQEEFNVFTNSSKPKEIDFSDKYDGPIGSEMDELVAAAIAKRKNELNIVIQDEDSKNAATWINKDNPPNIKIGEAMKLTDKIIENIGTKSVSFGIEDKQNEEANFLSLLKPPEENTDINTRLINIEANQANIINRLDKILKILEIK